MNRVLVVDDEAGMRSALEAHFLRRDWRVDTAANAGEALEKFRRVLHPLVVTDIRMPGADGFSVMREARMLAPHTAVILLTAFANVPDAVTAMKGGACDYVPKQLSPSSLDIHHIREDLVAKIKAAAESRHSRDRLGLLRKPPRAAHPPTRQISHSAPAIIALGVSTGGPKALQEMLPTLPIDLPVPILIVQHMPVGFTAPFAGRLNSLCAVSVCAASHGEAVRPGVVYLAPAGFHMTVNRPSNSSMLISLSDKVENQVHIPSVDVMMLSVASAFHSQAMGIIMTGMGSDGAQGMKAIHSEGGLTVGQDEASCAVYGMPRVCAEMGILDRVVPLSQIPYEILQATRYRKANVI
jgi:two-component system, chemotaxis family, protein-glutamate methylesterase/glutaminase